MQNVNKLALITGGSRGIGKAIAEIFAENGINIILTYNENKKAEIVKQSIIQKGVECEIKKLDLSNKKTFDLFKKNY